MSFDYFYGEQSEQFVFYRIPKVFYTDSRFRQLSRDARTLYGLLLDRVSLSAKNGWYDEKGRVYIIYTLQSAMSALSISDKTATKLFVELENIGLIERKRQGQGKPIIIYVKNFMDSEFLRLQKSKVYDSENSGATSQGSDILRGNNTDINNTKYSDTDFILSEREEERREYRQYLEKQLQIEWLKTQYPDDEAMIDEIFELILDSICTTSEVIRISGDDKPAAVVKSAFMKLNHEHIMFVLDGIKENNTRIKSIKSYLLASLYNAPMTISNYYRARVNNDMATGALVARKE
ncbi:MAG: replication initiator protein A [Pseudobutyrivibrio sp.]|nr:replication initiator protein A [Pseudobutyrivibrio sp.]